MTGRAAWEGPPDLPFATLQSALRLRPRRALSSAGVKLAPFYGVQCFPFPFP